MSSIKPDVVIVHGAWHTPFHFEILLGRLRQEGFQVHCPRLPTSNSKSPASHGLADDVVVIDNVVASLADAGRQVIVLAHSYGGLVATQALRYLSWHQRHTHGLPGGVINITYLAAFLLQLGGTTSGITAQRDHSLIKPEGDGFCFVHEPAFHFFRDLDFEEAAEYSDALVWHSVRAFQEPLTHTSWQDIPITYVYCTNDHTILLRWQRDMVQGVKDSGVNVFEETCDSGHSPFLSMPNFVIEVVLRVVERESKT